jgi:fucose 4-O-acetylase-like acetyltransferase
MIDSSAHGSTKEVVVADRDIHLDALKGLGILAVVLWHSLFAASGSAVPGVGTVLAYGRYVASAELYSPLYNIITSVNMPLLAFVSGLLLGRRPESDIVGLVRRRAWSLMVPWLAWVLLGRIGLFRDPATLVREMGVALLSPAASGLWFLYTLFQCYLVYALVRSSSKRDRALVVVAAAIAATVLLPIPDVFGVRYLSFLFPFFALGVIAATRAWWKSSAAVIGSGAAYVATLALTWPSTFAAEVWWQPMVRAVLQGVGLTDRLTNVWLLSLVHQSSRYLCGAAGIVLLFAVYSRAGTWFLSPQAWVGRLSLGVYVTHSNILTAVVAAGVVGVAPAFIVTCAVALATTVVLDRIPIVRNVFLGRAL